LLKEEQGCPPLKRDFGKEEARSSIKRLATEGLAGACKTRRIKEENLAGEGADASRRRREEI